MHTAPTPQDTPDLSDFTAFKAFATEWERQKLGTVDSLRWLCRYRTVNGLLASGAVVEVRTPGAKRPRLLVNRREFSRWLASQSGDAVRSGGQHE